MLTEDLETIYNTYHANSYATNLYIKYLQHKLDDTVADSDAYFAVLHYVNMLKEHVMCQGETTHDTVRMQTFGLTPVYQMMYPSNILQRLSHATNYTSERVTGGGSGIDDLSEYLKNNKLGLYVIRSISRCFIEYDTRNLTIRKFTEKLQSADNSGLNMNMLKMFDVIKERKTSAKPEYTTIKKGDSNATRWLVIRTINGETYDIMGYTRGNLYVNKLTIDMLERGPSPRIQCYQSICSDMLNEHLHPIQEHTLESYMTPMTQVATTIKGTILDYVGRRLYDEKPQTLGETLDIVTSTTIDDIVFKILIEAYNEFDTDSSPELAGTFLYNVQSIVQRFTKDIRERFIKSGLTEFMFKEVVYIALLGRIMTSLTDIVKGSAEYIFDPKKDMFVQLLNKKKLLKVEL
jgi:hypothetical protein